MVEDAQHVGHHQVSDGELPFEVVLPVEGLLEHCQAIPHQLFDLGPPRLRPFFFRMEEVEARELLDPDLHRIECGEHPRGRALALDAVAGQELLALLRDVERDGAAFKEHKAVFLDRRRLAERLARQVFRRSLCRPQRQLANMVGETCLLERPARAKCAHQRRGEIRNPFVGRQRDHARNPFCSATAMFSA